MEALAHVLGRYPKPAAADRTLSACLVAWGTHMALGRLGDIADVGAQARATTAEPLRRLEPLSEANDLIRNATAALPLVRHDDIGGVRHASRDGQKFETRINPIHARSAPKYVGLQKGGGSYALVANQVPINAKIIGAPDPASPSVFESLCTKTTDLQPDIHSTDTPGPHAGNCALLNVCGDQFAPRYRDLFDKVQAARSGLKPPSP
jgi:TnpA family transposase